MKSDPPSAAELHRQVLDGLEEAMRGLAALGGHLVGPEERALLNRAHFQAELARRTAVQLLGDNKVVPLRRGADSRQRWP